MFTPEHLYELIYLAPALLLSLTVHEYAHARTALAFGDATARDLGRCTLNPLAHLDPIGTIVLLVSRFIGWAKPVPVNPLNLHPRRLGSICVSLAGPMSNLLLAVLCALGLRAFYAWGEAPLRAAGHGSLADAAGMLLLYTSIANIGLCTFNLIPLFPLDGHHIAREMLPGDRQRDFMAWQVRYGGPVLLALVFLPTVVEIVTHRPCPIDPIGYLHLRALRIFGFLLG